MDSLELKNQIVNDFKSQHIENVEEGVLDEIVAGIKGTEKSYPANGSIVSAIFYARVDVEVVYQNKTKKHFLGRGGGAGTLGGGVLGGDIFTEDIEKMFSETIAFQVTCTPVYACILFLDRDSKLLGHFQAGALSMSCIAAGGAGTWR